jgi:hypothetical protein
MSWWKRKPETLHIGCVLFRGRWAARPQDFAYLADRGVTVGPGDRGEGPGWEARLSHPEWGEAALRWQPDYPLPPSQLMELDPRLSAEEKALAQQAGSLFALAATSRSENVLTDRKDLLRFLHAVMGDEGLVAVDHTSQSFWSRAALEDELAHDAELDIDAIYTIHYVQEDGASDREPEQRRAFWLHTHGLKEIGATDLDILAPSPDLAGAGHELVRALAFAALEGRLAPGGAPYALAEGIAVSAVGSRHFMEHAAAHAPARLRESLDDDHLDGHAIVCEPTRTGWLARLLHGSSPRPCRALSGPLPEDGLVYFSTAATQLMARRARQMLPRFRALVAELKDLRALPLVKLGYTVDGATSADEREHLWFEVHAFSGDAVDATLLNRPFRVAQLLEGARATHPLEALSDWAIMTPGGRVDPRSSQVLRFLRAHREELIAALAAGEPQ